MTQLPQLRVPFIDLRRRFADTRAEVSDAIDRVLTSGRLVLGPETETFEAEFAAFVGRRFVVAVSSGSEALRIALAAHGIGVGDEVVVPALTAVPTAAAVCAVGATPVFVDVDEHTGLLSAKSAESALSPRTRAILPVHLYGRPAPLEPLSRLGVPIIEDACQAHGALRGPAPSIAACYSFYPTKNLGGIGDGGAIATDDALLALKARRLRSHGLTTDYIHTEIATNARMSEVEAAVLSVGLRDLETRNRRRRQIAEAVRAAAPTLTWQTPHDRHVYHLCVARVANRDSFRDRLSVDTAVHYRVPLTQQPAYASFVRWRCPTAELWARECVSIPCYPEMTDDEVDEVCHALQAHS
jgi:dTDP-4-amino-4,6-dideoxygalactose transaminase